MQKLESGEKNCWYEIQPEMTLQQYRFRYILVSEKKDCGVSFPLQSRGRVQKRRTLIVSELESFYGKSR